MLRFLLFIIFIILMQRLMKTLQEQQKQQQEEMNNGEFEDIFQVLNIPAPSQPQRQRVPVEQEIQKTEKTAIVKKQIKKAEQETPGAKIDVVTPLQSEQAENGRTEPYSDGLLSGDKIEEGIVLSEILGPPKAYQRIRRSGEIGRHA